MKASNDIIILLNKHKRLLLTVLFLISLLVLGQILGIKDQLSISNFKLIFETNFFIATLIYIAIFIISNIMYIPGWISLAALIATIGAPQAYVLTLLAAFLSTIFSFYLIRFIGGDSLKKIKWKWVERLLSTMDRYPIKINIILRTVFVTAPWLNYTLGLSGVKFRYYAIGAMVGLPIPILVYTIIVELIYKNVLSLAY